MPMDSINTQKAKPRKMKAVAKKSPAQRLLDLFYRVIEITLVMVTIAKLCYQIVIKLESSSLSGFLINRHLAFVLGNAIVIALVAKCGFFMNQEPDARIKNDDFYDEFVGESVRGERRLHTDAACIVKQSEVNRAKQSSEDRRQNRAKQSMLENREKQNSGEEREKDIIVRRHSQNIERPRQSYKRSKSENLEGLKKISDDELRYKIESFIARQRRNQKED